MAGILEGEGSFGLSNNKTSPCIWFGMTDLDVVRRVRNLINPAKSVSIATDSRRMGYKQNYRLTVNGHHAVGWMMTIYPLMGERRKAKIREVLAVWKARTKPQHNAA